MKAFSDASGIRASGLHVAGEKYIAIKTDDRSVYGKKVCFSLCIYVDLILMNMNSS